MDTLPSDAASRDRARRTSRCKLTHLCSCLPGAAAAILVIAVGRPAAAVSAERELALHAGDGDVTTFLAWFSAVGIACLVGALLMARLGDRIWRRQRLQAAGKQASGDDADPPASLEPPANIELSVAGCMAVSGAIIFGALGVAVVMSDVAALLAGLKGASSESGPLEWAQSILWLASAALALLVAVRLDDANVRGLLILLAAGALLVAAREADLHEKLNPEVLGAWGVHYRRDWWFSADSPVLPRVLWACIGLIVAGVGGYFAWRGAGAVFTRGSRHGRLIWVLGATVLLMVLGYMLDDLLRYREGINLRQSQVGEETLELAASMAYFAAIIWAIRLARLKPVGSASADA